MRAVLGIAVNPDDIPLQANGTFVANYETIVAVPTSVASRVHIDIEKD